MPIGTIKNITGSTVDVEIADGNGVSTLHDVLVKQPIPGCKIIPPIGTKCYVTPEGPDYMVDGYFIEEDEESQAEFEEEQLQGGDFIVGNGKGAILGFYKGGLLIMMSNPTTGFMSSKTGNASMIGDMLNIMNNVYRLIVETKDGGCTLEEAIIRALDGDYVYKRDINANDGIYKVKYNHLNELTIDVNMDNPLVTLEGGTPVQFNFKAANGQKFTIEVDRLTADVQMTTEGNMGIDGKKIILGKLINPTPLDGILTSRCKCQKTLINHTSPSTKVFAE